VIAPSRGRGTDRIGRENSFRRLLPSPAPIRLSPVLRDAAGARLPSMHAVPRPPITLPGSLSRRPVRSFIERSGGIHSEGDHTINYGSSQFNIENVVTSVKESSRKSQNIRV
jgi:hypothetical protein